MVRFLKSSNNYKQWDKWSIIPWKRHLTNQKWQTVRHTALPSIKAAACLVSAVARRQNIQLKPSHMLPSHSYATSRRAHSPLCGLPCHTIPPFPLSPSPSLLSLALLSFSPYAFFNVSFLTYFFFFTSITKQHASNYTVSFNFVISNEEGFGKQEKGKVIEAP